MSYNTLLKYENIQDKSKRLIEYAKYYQNTTIQGLHYVNFDKYTNTISISHPNHRTHHLSTSFLIKQKDGLSINTVRSYASNIKKFLDFLLIWKLEVNNCDLLIVVSAFISYLRCIDSNSAPKFSNTMIYYSTLSKIPLNNSAISYGNIIQLGYDSNGFMTSNNWISTSSRQTIKDVVIDTLKYLKFLKESTEQYKTINYNDIPMKLTTSKSMLSGTLGEKKYEHPDVDFILSFAGFKEDTTLKNPVSNLMVLSLDEVNLIIEAVPSSNFRDKLLFQLLKCFGLREGEASSLKIDASNLSTNYMFLDKEKAKKELREKLNGDIVYNLKIKKWTCIVSNNNSNQYDRQAKTGSRIIPLLFPKDAFEDALLYALIQRTIIMKQTKKEHNFLLINVSNQVERGNPISGTTIYDRFKAAAKKLKRLNNIDLKDYSPHSIRHFFATYLIKIKKYTVSDVSHFLGHSDESITLTTYYHYIDNNAIENDESKKILEKLKEQVVEDE